MKVLVLAGGAGIQPRRITITRCGSNYGPYQFPERIIPLFMTNFMDGRWYRDNRSWREPLKPGQDGRR